MAQGTLKLLCFALVATAVSGHAVAEGENDTGSAKAAVCAAVQQLARARGDETGRVHVTVRWQDGDQFGFGCTVLSTTGH